MGSSVGPTRSDGKHEVVTVLQRIELADTVAVRPAAAVDVTGFEADTLVREALLQLEQRTGLAFESRIDKRIPVSAGLGGGSSDAGTALRLANQLLPEQLEAGELQQLAAGLGSDVPFFAQPAGACLGRGDGSVLEPIELPIGYVIVLALPHGVVKASTADVYRAFDRRNGQAGFDERSRALLDVLPRISSPEDLAALPANDLASSELASELLEHEAFRAEVSGAGPAVYGLFVEPDRAGRAAAALSRCAATWVCRPMV